MESLDSHPACDHGPALLFERRIDDKCEQFYACSAYRDQSECPLYIPAVDRDAKSFNRDAIEKNVVKSLELSLEKTTLMRKVSNTPRTVNER